MTSAPLTALRAEDLRDVVVLFRNTLRRHQAALNRLNVYPVPDGDTGTNMALTLESVVAELDGADTDMASTCKAISHGSLMGARGNSGVILSQILRGLAKEWSSDDAVGPAAVITGLRAASVAADAAVMRPVEGTILSVARGTADAAEASGASNLADLVSDLSRASRAALAYTPEQLPVLKAAGVVDAGGAGFCLLIDVLANVVADIPLPEPSADDDHEVTGDGHSFTGTGGVDELRYEVMYFLEASDHVVPAFKELWATLGDSIVVVGGEGIWNCHIHTDDIGAAIEAGVDAGRPRQIRVTDLHEQVDELHAEERWVREQSADATDEPTIPTTPVTCAVVAVGAGAGLARLLRSLGAQAVVTGGQSMNPSTQDLLDAVEAVASDHVIILPNNKNIIPVAKQVDALTAKSVWVLPTRSVSEGLAALIAYDPDAEGSDNSQSMGEAASAVVTGEITRAVRDAPSDAGQIAAGDFLGISTLGGIRTIGTDLADVTCRLLAELITPKHEVVTLLEGEGSSTAVTRTITEWAAEQHPGLAIEVHHGGQPLYPYLLGIE